MPDKRLALAWQRHDQGRLQEALQLAREALGGEPTNRSEWCAALGWFLLASNLADEAANHLEESLQCHPGCAALHWYLGLVHFRGRRLEAARDALITALQIEPALDEAATSLAWVLSDLGRFSEATSYARTALAIKANPDRLALLGWLLFRQDQHDEAVLNLESALSREPLRINTRCILANALQCLGRNNEAMNVLSDGILRSPDDPELLRAFGWLSLERGALAAAEPVAERLISLCPDRADSWLMSGVTARQRGHKEKAEHDLAKVVSLDATLDDARLQLAATREDLKHFSAASETLQPLLARVPANPEALAMQARIFLSRGHPDEARALIHDLLRQQPDNSSSWHLLSIALMQCQRPHVAALALGRARRLSPESHDIWRHTADWALLAGDNQTARSAVEHLLSLASDDPNNRLYAAGVLAASGDLESALLHTEKAVSIDQTLSQGWCLLADLLHRKGRLEAAETALQTARELSPLDGNSSRLLGRICLARNRNEDAISAFAAAAASSPNDGTLWLELADTCWNAGRLDEALRATKRALDIRRQWPEVLYLRSRIIAEQLQQLAIHQWQDAAPSKPQRQRLSFTNIGPTRDGSFIQGRARILVVDDAAGYRADCEERRRADRILAALRGCDVTLFLLHTTIADWCDLYAERALAIELVLDESDAGLERFLNSRCGFFTTVIVRGALSMACFGAVMNRRPDLTQSLCVIYETGVVGVRHEIRLARRRGLLMSRSDMRHRLRAEFDLARLANTVLVLSEVEAAKYRAAGIRDMRALGYSMRLRASFPDWSERDGLLFVGEVLPGSLNEESLLWLIDEVLPLLGGPADRPILRIVGECRSPCIAARASARIQLLGRAEEMSKHYDLSRLFVAPMPCFSGLPFGVIDAACNGLPAVVTPSSLRQLGWRAGHEMLSSTDARSFADAIACLYNDRAEWLAVQKAALGAARRDFSPSRFDRILVEACRPVSDAVDRGTSPGKVFRGSVRIARQDGERLLIENLYGNTTASSPTLAANPAYALCSLCTRDYLPLARTMIASVRRHFQGAFHLLLVDSDDSRLIPDGVSQVRMSEIIDPEAWEDMRGRYNEWENCSAIKPFLVRYLARQSSSPVIYLDADTYLLAPLDPLLPACPDFSALLTPHLVFPLPPERSAAENHILRVGTYNAGVFGVGVGAGAMEFLDWWADRLFRFSYDAHEHGLFMDQKYLNLVPSYFRNHYVCFDAGLNLGPWRFSSELDFSEDPAGRLTFCGELVTLMHMSGFDPERPDVLTLNHSPVTGNTPLANFLLEYSKEVIRNR